MKAYENIKARIVQYLTDGINAIKETVDPKKCSDIARSMIGLCEAYITMEEVEEACETGEIEKFKGYFF